MSNNEPIEKRYCCHDPRCPTSGPPYSNPEPSLHSQAEKVELPPLDVCPEELRHGYPDCDCDLVGGDESCEKKPTLDELDERYSPLKQRERQLTAALVQVEGLQQEVGRLHLLEIKQFERAEALLKQQEPPEKVWSRAWLAAKTAAILVDPWTAHISKNPIANILESPAQCVEVQRELILAIAVPPYTPATESK